jgi:hypothetical protein
MAVVVFWSHGGPWKNVAVFEGVSATVTALALAWERFTGASEEKKNIE